MTISGPGDLTLLNQALACTTVLSVALAGFCFLRYRKLENSGREIQSTVARLPNSADDLALAVSKEGAHGLRVALREKAFELNTKIAELLANLAVQAREHDPAIEETEA